MPGVWTNNLQGLKNGWLIWTAVAGLSRVVLSNGTVKSGDDFVGGSASPMANIDSYGEHGCRVLFGTGSTAPTAADYKMEATASSITVVSVVNNQAQYDIQNGTITKSAVVSIRNSSDQPVTLREWGLYSNPSGGLALLYREVMDTPVTLGGYQGATITLTRSITLTDPV